MVVGSLDYTRVLQFAMQRSRTNVLQASVAHRPASYGCSCSHMKRMDCTGGTLKYNII